MVLSETSYKSFAGTNMHNPQFGTQYGESAMANPLGISVARVPIAEEIGPTAASASGVSARDPSMSYA